MENKKFWGTFIGSIIGYAFAKIYLIWAMLYNEMGLRMANRDGWRDTPLWDMATRNPEIFTIIIIIIFSVLGYAFIVTTNPQKVDEKETPLQQ